MLGGAGRDIKRCASYTLGTNRFLVGSVSRKKRDALAQGFAIDEILRRPHLRKSNLPATTFVVKRIVQKIWLMVVVVALAAAQVLPAFASCHSGRSEPLPSVNFAMAVAAASLVERAFHGSLTSASLEVASSNADLYKSASSTKDSCLGSCGCECGVGGSMALPSTPLQLAAIVPVARAFFAAESQATAGRSPAGPRRPPRIAA